MHQQHALLAVRSDLASTNLIPSQAAYDDDVHRERDHQADSEGQASGGYVWCVLIYNSGSVSIHIIRNRAILGTLHKVFKQGSRLPGGQSPSKIVKIVTDNNGGLHNITKFLYRNGLNIITSSPTYVRLCIVKM